MKANRAIRAVTLPDNIRSREVVTICSDRKDHRSPVVFICRRPASASMAPTSSPSQVCHPYRSWRRCSCTLLRQGVGCKPLTACPKRGCRSCRWFPRFVCECGIPLNVVTERNQRNHNDPVPESGLQDSAHRQWAYSSGLRDQKRRVPTPLRLEGTTDFMKPPALDRVCRTINRSIGVIAESLHAQRETHPVGLARDDLIPTVHKCRLNISNSTRDALQFFGREGAKLLSSEGDVSLHVLPTAPSVHLSTRFLCFDTLLTASKRYRIPP